jgi:hypothetical protein
VGWKDDLPDPTACFQIQSLQLLVAVPPMEDVDTLSDDSRTCVALTDPVCPAYDRVGWPTIGEPFVESLAIALRAQDLRPIAPVTRGGQ